MGEYLGNKLHVEGTARQRLQGGIVCSENSKVSVREGEGKVRRSET